MAAIRHNTRRRSSLAVGVDVGGTWVRVLARRADGTQVSVRMRRAGRAHELRNLFRALWKRQRWSAADVDALVVASRGIWTRTDRLALARRLGGLARRLMVLSDAQAALLGALDGQPGVLVLSGTGSIVIGRDGRGRWIRTGGMGPLLGDEGSAFWLGREWLRVTTAGEDFLPARRRVYSPDPVARIAALAPRVLRSARRGDRRARRIVQAGQAHLAGWAQEVARRLRLNAPVAVSWAGSVLSDPWFRTGLRAAVARTGLRARWQPPAETPVEAALRLAERLAGRARKPRGPGARGPR
jgi:N-acetylglucosamine kinase-like BadF-type ATPase